MKPKRALLGEALSAERLQKRVLAPLDLPQGRIALEGECSKVLQQIAAIRGAINGLMGEVLEGHIREHLGAHDITAAERDADVEQVVSVLRSYLK